MKILVTGVGGFIGSHVAKKVSRLGHEVVGVDDFSTGSRANVPEGIELLTGDLAIPATITRIPLDIDVVMHLAGQSSGEISFDNPLADMQKNVASTLNLVDHARRTGACKFIYASSMSVYGNASNRPTAETESCAPLSCYGVGKLAAENYLRVFSSELPTIAFRMFNVYGPGQDLRNLRQGMVSIFVAQALSDARIVVKGPLERFRDFIYIDDVTDMWCSSIERSVDGFEVFNLGTGRKTFVGELIEIIKIESGVDDVIVDGNTPGDQLGIYAETAQLFEAYGRRDFVPLEEGMRKFFEALRA